MHGHQLDGGNAERAQVRDDGFGCDTGISTAQLLGYLRMQHRHPADMRLVDDGLVGRGAGPLLSAPIEARIDDRAQGRKRRAVSIIDREVAVRVAQMIAEQFVRPL